MVDTLSVGTSCSASIVKMSVDFPNEAALCQRFLSGRAQMSCGARIRRRTGLLRRTELLAPPLADPRAPSVIPKWNDPALGDERVNLRAERRRFCWPKVIVDNQPALIIQQVAVAIQIPADVIVSIKNEEAYLAAG